MRKSFLALMCCLPLSALCSGCSEDILLIDKEKAREAAVEYFKEKYDIEPVVQSYINKSDSLFDQPQYTLIRFTLPDSDDDNEYMIYVEPSGETDADGDGYYDLYQITGDSYFHQHISPMVTEWMNTLTAEYIEYHAYKIFCAMAYKDAFKDMYIPQTVDEIISKGSDATLMLYIIISESEYIDDEDALKKLEKLTECLQSIGIDCKGFLCVYNQDTYDRASKLETYWDYMNSLRGFETISYVNLF